MQRQYGWKRQKKDSRDQVFSASEPILGLPPTSDLRSNFPPCYDQGRTSACTAHGIVGALQSAQFLAGIPQVMLSRLFLYYNERMMEGDPDKDAGAEIRDGIKACNLLGLLPEAKWPFDEAKVLIRPPDEAYTTALTDRIHFYATVDLRNTDHIKLALSHKIPVVFGFAVYSYFESAEMERNGILNMPAEGESHLGGHCVLIVGHDDSEKMFWIRNSWGSGWGINGYFKMSYEYVNSNLCSDGWCLRLK